MNRAVPTITETADELKPLLKAACAVRRAQRLQMLSLFASKQVKTRKAAAPLLGMHRETLGAWVALSETGGTRRLAQAGRSPWHPPMRAPRGRSPTP